MLSDGEPAHPILSAVGFGSSAAAAAWLLPSGRGFQPDPLMLVVIGSSGAVAGRMLVGALSRRAVAGATSMLVLACYASIRLRVQQGTWSGLPVPLIPITVLAAVAWLPRSPHHPSTGRRRASEVRSRAPRPPGAQPMCVTDLLVGRWALLGAQPLPAADRGGQSRVHLALDTWDRGRQVVAKLPSHEHADRSAVCLASEAKLLRACRGSPHVVKLLDAGFDRGGATFFLILARHGRGSLARFLTASSSFPIGLALAVEEDILRGLVDLHEHCGRPIAHGDLNPRNLLLCENRSTPEHPAVVICDLAMARRVPRDPPEDEALTADLVYSPWYAAPELLQGPTSWGLEADIYGAASVLYELVTGQPPLRRESALLGKDFAALVRDGVQPASAGSLNPTLPGDLVELLDCCLAARPSDRPGPSRDVLVHLRQVRRGVGGLSVSFASLRQWDGTTRIRLA
jgi:Protein kinase domain